MNEAFRMFAQVVSEIAGGAWAFIIVTLVTLGWLALGPAMHFSDTWQLIISTISSAVTFLMVFLIQNAQNRDTKALNLKLDALIRAIENAPDEVTLAEDLSEAEIMRRKQELTRDVVHQQ